MKLRQVIRMSAAWAALVWVAVLGCGDGGDDPSTGTHIGNPGDLEFRVSSALSEAPEAKEVRFTDVDGTPFALAEARVVIRDVELYLPDGLTCAAVAGSYSGATCEAGDDKLEVTGPFVVDLLTGASTPSLEGVKVPPLRWRRVDYRLDDADETLLPSSDPLFGSTLYLRAAFEQAGMTSELRGALRFNEVVRVEDAAGIQLPEGGKLFVELDAGVWLAQAPVSACVASGELPLMDGVATLHDDDDLDDDDDDDDDIDDDVEESLPDDEAASCGDLERAIKAGVRGSSRLRAE